MAGAAKTTIYRWWPNREALAIAAFLAATEPRIAFAETGSAADDIRRQMRRLAAVYRGKTGRIIRGIVAAAEADSSAAQAFVEGYIRPRRAAARSAIERGLANGEFRAGLDPETVIDALYGPIFYRLLVGHAALDAAWVDGLASAVLYGCLNRISAT